MIAPFAHLAVFLVEVLNQPRGDLEIVAIRVDRGQKAWSGARQEEELLRPELHAVALELAAEKRVHHLVLVAKVRKLLGDDSPQFVDEFAGWQRPHDESPDR